MSAMCMRAYVLGGCRTVLCCAVLRCLACVAVEARSMEQAIDALQSLGVTSESPAVDKHPEK